MHPEQIAQKTAREQERIAALAALISSALDFENTVDFFPPARNPRLAALKQREAIGDFLERVVLALSAPDETPSSPDPDPDEKPRHRKKPSGE